MIPHWQGYPMEWMYAPKLLTAGKDEFSHKRAKSHNSKRDEPLCKSCRNRKVRGKCRTEQCKGKGR